ncbi:MAG: (2Fe-2S)-binding protein [Myxococcales bacterium]|nr:(2Fe-2S)-binding protein [Myxococcales bacterium]
MKIELTINNKPVQAEADPMKRLLDFLREDCLLTGTKEGCGEGECGACSVEIDGEVVNSCLVAVGQVHGANILTVEGLAPREDSLSRLQQAFVDAGAAQCGICTPGMLLAAHGLLARNPRPSRHDIRTAIAGNLCRCTGYQRIVDAVEMAAREGDQ